MQNKARSSALKASLKGDLTVSHPREKGILAFGEHFKLRKDEVLAVDLGEALCEEAMAVAGDFENEVRRHLIAPGVVVEELRIDLEFRCAAWEARDWQGAAVFEFRR